MTLSGYIMKVRKIESPLAEENYDIVIYYLWMMQFVFFIGFPALFFGPVVGVIVGPILFFSVVIYTNKKKENQTKTPYISLDTKNSDNTSGNLQETRKSEYSE
jgi:type III secretory pathway component EscV